MTRAPEPTELDLHLSVAGVLKKFGDGDRWAWTHIPSGEKRTAATGALLKRMGLKRGWLDFIFIDIDGSVRFLELKTTTGELSTDQVDFMKKMRARGITCAVARSLTQAISILSEWQVIKINIARGVAA